MITRTVINTAVAAIAASTMISFTANADDKEIAQRVRPVGHLVVLGTTETATTETATTETATAETATAETATAETAAATETKTEPGTETAVAEAAPTAAADAGKDTYNTACFACHGTGAAGAPVVGNKDAWANRVSQGTDTLYSHAINGFNAMPPKGGSATLSDEEVKAVVDYMIAQSS